MIYQEILKFASIQLDEVTTQIRDYLTENIDPIYRDMVLKEHFWSIDFMDMSDINFPPFIVEWVNELKASDPDIVYFRFEQW